MASGNGMSVAFVASLELFCAYVDPPNYPLSRPKYSLLGAEKGLIIRVLVRWQLQA